MEASNVPALWASLVTIFGVWGITVVSPGPNFLAASHTAASQSRRTGLLVATGIAIGTTIWATASLLGLALLFQTTGWLYQAVKYLGAAYLIIVGLRMAFSQGPTSQHRASSQAPSPARTSGATAAPAGFSTLGALRYGLQVDLSNPKAAAFFTSLFALAVPPQAPGWFQALIIALVVIMAGGWYALVACAMAMPAVSARYRASQRAIARLTGFVFVFFGARLALLRD